MTIVNGLNIRFDSIENALAELSEFSGRVQLRVRKIECKDVLTIIVEAENLTAQIVTQAVLGKLPELQSQHQRGLVITTIVPRGGIAIEDYKTLHIVDERVKTQ
jgi:phenylacetate-coenzyme A ligase PaaK-like adenylate-forming protein